MENLFSAYKDDDDLNESNISSEGSEVPLVPLSSNSSQPLIATSVPAVNIAPSPLNSSPSPVPVRQNLSNDFVDNISGSEDEKSPPHPGSPVRSQSLFVSSVRPKPKKTLSLVAYATEEAESDNEGGIEAVLVGEEESDNENILEVTGVEHSSALDADLAASLSRKVLNLSENEIQLPPAPPGQCSKRLQEKIKEMYRRYGENRLEAIERQKEYRNPSIYEKLIDYVGIDEKSTNYPQEIYDPSIWGKESYYDELGRAQKIEMDKREKERKERNKIAFTEAKKEVANVVNEMKRKSKWDAQPLHGRASGLALVGQPGLVNLTKSSSASGSSKISCSMPPAKKKK